jgi:hypothetical protein
LWIEFVGMLEPDYPLDSLPAFNGLIAAAGRLYPATIDGKLVCFAKP